MQRNLPIQFPGLLPKIVKREKMPMRAGKLAPVRQKGTDMEKQWIEFGIKIEQRLNETLHEAIISNPRKSSDSEISKIKIRPVALKNKLKFQASIYKGKQVLHENYEAKALKEQLALWLQNDFKQLEMFNGKGCLICLSGKKGNLTMKEKGELPKTAEPAEGRIESIKLEKFAHNRHKNYILKEDIPVPFLIDLKVQTSQGKIVHASYDKFKQINRFLEFVEDIMPCFDDRDVIRILDFGCGKSYLTFALYHYFHVICKRNVEITGLDLKKDVIENCNRLAKKYGYDKLQFLVGDIKDYESFQDVDLVVTLHACDVATDYALHKAINWNAKAILSVPCCHHELNPRLDNAELAPMLEYGIVRDRFASLATDTLRAIILEKYGYETQLLEFIDMTHTPKNILVRGVKRKKMLSAAKQEAIIKKEEEFSRFLGAKITLQKLLEEGKE